MIREIRTTLAMITLLTVLTGVIYPLAITAVSAAVFPWQARGSLLQRGGTTVGSHWIGQPFTSPRYFHPRPSATTDPDPKDPSKTVPAPYEASASTGSNAGPTAKSLVDRVRDDVAHWRASGAGARVPVDLVTTSASGLDPHISPAAAYYQVPAVAAARGLPVSSLQDLVAKHVEPRMLGLLGEPVVNVLELNLALDRLPAAAPAR